MVKTKKGVQIFKFHRGFERLSLSILLSHIIVPFFILITKIWQLHQGNQWKLNEEMRRKLQNSVFKESWFLNTYIFIQFKKLYVWSSPMCWPHHRHHEGGSLSHWHHPPTSRHHPPTSCHHHSPNHYHHHGLPDAAGVCQCCSHHMYQRDQSNLWEWLQALPKQVI